MSTDWRPIESLREWLDGRPGDDVLYEVAEFRAGKLIRARWLAVRDVVVPNFDRATHWRAP
jgi:hypothetical protein